MHFLVLFLILNHQCMVTNHLKSLNLVHLYLEILKHVCNKTKSTVLTDSRITSHYTRLLYFGQLSSSGCINLWLQGCPPWLRPFTFSPHMYLFYKVTIARSSAAVSTTIYLFIQNIANLPSRIHQLPNSTLKLISVGVW